MKRLLRAHEPLRLITMVVAALVMAVSSLPIVPFARAQSDELIGDFTVSISSESISGDIPDGSTIVGRWRISFNQDGTYEGERLDLGVLVRGTYEADDETVTITDQEGVVSCSNAVMVPVESGDVSVATYRYEIDANSLTLTPEEEHCALRRILLSTTDLVPFVACATEPIDLTLGSDDADDDESEGASSRGASPRDILAADDATPTEEPEVEAEIPTAESEAASPTAEPDADAAIYDAQATPDDAGSTEEQIDALLGQMTACWASGEPGRFLALWSEEFRAQYLEDETAIDGLRAAMQVPLSWERAGDVRMDGDDRAEAVVRTTALDEEEFVRYLFVFEDGAWRWDGSAA